MQRRIIVLGVLLAFAASPLLAAGKLFDGEEKAFVFVGYSTSYRWPNILEHKINRQFEDAIVNHVMNAASGGAPMGTWVAAEDSEDWQRSYGRMLRDWFLPLESRGAPAAIATANVSDHSRTGRPREHREVR